jgi:hypothetical protein
LAQFIHVRATVGDDMLGFIAEEHGVQQMLGYEVFVLTFLGFLNRQRKNHLYFVAESQFIPAHFSLDIDPHKQISVSPNYVG